MVNVVTVGGAVSRVKTEKEEEVVEFNVDNLTKGEPSWANYVKAGLSVSLMYYC